jgi:hypothetical protein
VSEKATHRSSSAAMIPPQHRNREESMDTITFTKTAAPAWLLAMWKEIDDKTFGKGFRLLRRGCSLQPRCCRLARTRGDPK